MAIASQKISRPVTSDEEKKQRQEAVNHAFAENRIEGIKPNPLGQPIFDAYIAGEIDLDEMGRRLRALATQ